MPLQTKGKILANKQVNEQDYKLVVSVPEIIEELVPGQFLHVKCTEGLDPLLRRPLSIHKYDEEKGELIILYRVFGKGTKALSRRESGEEIDLMGPLGNGFDLFNLKERIMVVGGGIGSAPLMALIERLVELNKEVTVLIGANNQDQILCESKLKELATELKFATVDGSYGYKGYITELLAEKLKQNEYDQIFACGPTPMLKAMEPVIEDKDIDVQVSLEARMGCGTGACLSCVCKVKVQNDDGFAYKKVCTDGPVFNMDEVILDE
ncbi:dihydroorotate dehydrogenase electron transfer subunit [Selenihalanaerobacter shriftii]|uniref:Dihydroorotate dehydrogenase B (NAD(+)), electron transfer subunit n=1 Tax=Selenihalanaerobacter shriftii TaxID=142842 RepID=A0A1T4QF80_9FIRM|nr:dihydroorotate dehydrogenase electron transfer subunit [Selenihalanaerobacter shriftii]SKA02161.1 dihydroorotate dehydrogenase electron transfer subunit [Selenihalanaerobacter shriftii]